MITNSTTGGVVTAPSVVTTVANNSNTATIAPVCTDVGIVPSTLSFTDITTIAGNVIRDNLPVKDSDHLESHTENNSLITNVISEEPLGSDNQPDDFFITDFMNKTEIDPNPAGINTPLEEGHVEDKKDVDDKKMDVYSDFRSASRTPSMTSNSDMCRICHCEAESDKPLIQPCFCMGTLKHVHQACVQQWIKSSDTKCCELCKFDFIMETRFKPFKLWEKLDMSPVERRKILCSVMFHIVALTCVVWSLYVLIDRTTEEIADGNLQWPFWTKLIVVAIGFTGGLVFMYVQCKMYGQLCKRWRAYNRVIFVQNCPDEILQNQARPDKLLAAKEDAAAIAATSNAIEVQGPSQSPPLNAFQAIV